MFPWWNFVNIIVIFDGDKNKERFTRNNIIIIEAM